MTPIYVVPVTLKEAGRLVELVHRHHHAPQGARWAIGLVVGSRVLAVAIVGDPRARALRGLCFEVYRVASEAPVEVNACSRLYGAATAAALAMGYRRGVTYTRADEPGTSLRAANWRPTARADRREWDSDADHRQRRLFKMPATEVVDRIRWEIGPDAADELPELADLGRRPKARAA